MSCLQFYDDKIDILASQDANYGELRGEVDGVLKHALIFIYRLRYYVYTSFCLDNHEFSLQML